MRKILSLFLCLLLLSASAVMMSGCEKDPNEGKEYTVSFELPQMFSNHPPTYTLFTPNLTKNVQHGTKVSTPNLYTELTDYQKENYSCLDVSMYTFIGWFQEEGCINVWKFYETPVTCDMILYAKYELNENLM